MADSHGKDTDPLWFKDAIIYQLHVKAFSDSNGDGMGDFRGLMGKLDYLQELGVTALWLLPFYPSPLMDDGYDIADYTDVHPDYGTIGDFRDFLREAHRRGLKVVTELVLNHTSDRHAWFQRARRAAAGSSHRNFYVWSDTQEKYRDARIIFQDFEISNWTWDPVAKANFWHRFYSHQPDLNFDNPAVHRALFRVLDFWLEMGVDGLRLDAVPYLYEREGTNCENLPETHAFLRKLRAHVDGRFPSRMLLAEANQWPEDAAAYFGAAGDECHMNFHFPLMPRIYMALQMEDRFPIIDILDSTPQIPEKSQWGIFLRNHDELTLEMVTDEERDYMYRVYARDPRARINLGIRRRLAPLMNNDRRMIEIMNVLLMTLPGTPIIYYGDEIGMGDNYYLGDRNGVRTPMQWSPDRNAGFSCCNPQRLYFPLIIDPEYHYETVNVENQLSNPSSLLWWMRHLIATRRRFSAFGRGTIEFLKPDNGKVLVYLRRHGEEKILVVINLARTPQFVELDLSAYSGHVPETVFSRTPFPAISDLPYRITLGPHGYFMFVLRPQTVEERLESPDREMPQLDAPPQMDRILSGKNLERLERRILPAYLAGCRWFGGKGRRVQRISLLEFVPLDSTGGFAFLRVAYADGNPDRYLLPLICTGGDRAMRMREEFPQAVVALLEGEAVLADAIYDADFRDLLFRGLAGRKRLRGRNGELALLPERPLRGMATEGISSSVMKIEQSNTAIRYGGSYFFKLYRRIEEGVNPDAEIIRFLSGQTAFGAVPRYLGGLEYRVGRDEPVVLGIVQRFVENEGDAWQLALDSVRGFFDRVQAGERGAPPRLPVPPARALAEELRPLEALVGDFFLEMVALLGRRTAQMHAALASSAEPPAFRPEAFSLLYQRSLLQGMRAQARRIFQALSRRLSDLPEQLREEAQLLLAEEKRVLGRFSRLTEMKFDALKTRTHGDYHLGQVLFTGKDFVVIDFEGEPARPLSERRLKRAPLRDVAGMIRSFDYACRFELMQQATALTADDLDFLAPWGEAWYRCCASVFLDAYLDECRGERFIPAAPRQRDVLLEAFLLEKSIYELGYEIANRPAWIGIPLRAILDLAEGDE